MPLRLKFEGYSPEVGQFMVDVEGNDWITYCYKWDKKLGSYVMGHEAHMMVEDFILSAAEKIKKQRGIR